MTKLSVLVLIVGFLPLPTCYDSEKRGEKMARIVTGKVYSAIADGINGERVLIEVSISPGLPSFDIIGLCDASIRESKGRILTAIKKSGFGIPKGHITVSISPSFINFEITESVAAYDYKMLERVINEGCSGLICIIL